MNFEQLMRAWGWKPLRHCPGRFVLAGETSLSMQELLGDEFEVLAYRVEAARDTVLVVRLESGGLISYSRADGTLLHTLNTPDGFRRKLRQLGIRLPSTLA
ncbi:MAG TPA: hypothetical protein VGB17_07705 [Pyrinomonadaceae bacterium]|jgi:hypothetical protein